MDCNQREDYFWRLYDDVVELWDRGDLTASAQLLGSSAARPFTDLPAMKVARGLQQLHASQGFDEGRHQLETVRTLVENAITPGERDARTLLLAATLLVDVGESKAAEPYLRSLASNLESLTDRRDLAAYYFTLGRSLAAKQCIPLALEALGTAVSLEPVDEYQHALNALQERRADGKTRSRRGTESILVRVPLNKKVRTRRFRLS